MRLIWVAVATILGFGDLTAQTPSRAQFDAATLKPNTSYSEKGYLRPLPGRLRAGNIAPRALILLAWDLENYQLGATPEWLGSEHYDLEAITAGTTPIQEMEHAMLQSLIEERFALKFHFEAREISGYQMTVNGRGKLIKSIEGSCRPYAVNAPPPPANIAGTGGPMFCGYPRMTDNGSTGERIIEGKGVSITDLARALTRGELHAPVADNTKLIGRSDLTLKWTSNTATTVAELPPLSTALSEQLGLKLRATKTLVRVMVIDQVSKPSSQVADLK